MFSALPKQPSPDCAHALAAVAVRITVRCAHTKPAGGQGCAARPVMHGRKSDILMLGHALAHIQRCDTGGCLPCSCSGGHADMLVLKHDLQLFCVKIDPVSNEARVASWSCSCWLCCLSSGLSQAAQCSYRDSAQCSSANSLLHKTVVSPAMAASKCKPPSAALQITTCTQERLSTAVAAPWLEAA